MSVPENARWAQALADAPTTRDVIAIVQDYVDHLPPVVLAQLPARYRPRPLACASDVSDYAYELKRGTWEGELGAPQAAMEQLAMLFAEASRRLTYITGPHQQAPGAGPAQAFFRR
jgi:hypothetical protein